MVVLKKSDVEESFSAEKLAQSIRAASAEAEEPLDIELLLAEFKNIVADMEQITTGQINVIVYGLLYAKGATKTLERYASHKGYK
ncbi:hypothetical protein LJC64_00340 [Ruminococcaceae bacterium OttesenSCG-928-A11]|nr:hypothetical protein [Ruminococcaceae bacterium OttesenSCG-928-A11]